MGRLTIKVPMVAPMPTSIVTRIICGIPSGNLLNTCDATRSRM